MHAGTLDEAKKKEDEVVRLLESGKAVVDESGILRNVIIDEDAAKDVTKVKDVTKRKRKRKLVKNVDSNADSEKQKPKKKKVDTKSKKVLYHIILHNV